MDEPTIDVLCPICKAEPGKKCRNTRKEVNYLHPERRGAVAPVPSPVAEPAHVERLPGEKQPAKPARKAPARASEVKPAVPADQPAHVGDDDDDKPRDPGLFPGDHGEGPYSRGSRA